MTTSPDDVTHHDITTGSSIQSRDVAYYFESSVVFIGVIGTTANALILYAMVASKQHRKQIMIFNQNALDLFSSVLLILTYSVKLCTVRLSDSVGHWLCVWLLSENIVWCGILSSKINLMLVTVERYLKVVHGTFSKKYLQGRVTYTAAVFSWLSGFALSIGITLTTTGVVDGSCYSYVFWSSRRSQLAYGIWYFLFFYALMLTIFFFCYWRILMVIRRQATVMAGHDSTGSSAHQAKSNQLQANVVKTMIIVSAFYAVSDLPMNVYYLLLNLHANLTLLQSGYYTVLFISFLYICTNPFVYAAKFDPVKRIIVRLIPCRTTTQEPNSIYMSTTAAPRAAST